MSVVLLILTNSTPAFSDSQTSQFKPHPSSGNYSAVACRSTGNNAPIQFSGNAATVARTFLSPSEIIGGNLRSNADIKISGNGYVNGDATPAPGHIVNKTGNGTVTGSIQPAAELLDCSIGDLTQLITWVQQNNNDSSIPPTDQGRMPWGCGNNPPPNDPWQFCLKGNETIHLSGGTYWFSSWSQSGNSKIIIDGYVRILVTGSIGLSGNLSINADGNPYNLLIFAIPDNSFSLQMSGNTIFNGLIYGPAITAQFSGQSTINGNLITQDINASGQAKLKRWIDETVPEITFALPTATCMNSQNITASLTINDNESGIDPESIYLYLDGNPVAVSANPADSSWHSVNMQAALSGLSEGNHQLMSEAWDRAGNMSQKSFDFIIDRTPPSIAITFPADGAAVQQNQVVVMGVASDNAKAECGLSVSVNGMPVIFEDGGQWLTTISLNEGETKAIEAIAMDGSGNSSSISISIGQMASPVNLKTAPISLTIYDKSPFPGNGNGVFENNEEPRIIPSWANISSVPLYVMGIASDWSGPLGPENYTILNNDANYDTILNHHINNCSDNLNCYQLKITNHQKNIHLDAKLHEILTDNEISDGLYDWPVHIGNSFTDIAPDNPSYKEIETLLHYGITAGCGIGTFNCPSSPNITRGTMAIWLSRVLAMGEGNVPMSGPIPIPGSPNPFQYACGKKDQGEPWASIFNDIIYTTDPNNQYFENKEYCRYAHYLYAAGIMTDSSCPAQCTGTCFCPQNLVTRKEMAKAIALAISIREDFIRYTYNDPTTHKYYSCDYIASPLPDMAFSDVHADDHLCRHIHYLWAKDIIEGKNNCANDTPCSASPCYFCPNNNIKREEFAKILVQAFQLELYKADIARESFCAYSGNVSWGRYDFLGWPGLSYASIDRIVNLTSSHGFGRGFRTFTNIYLSNYVAGDLIGLTPYQSYLVPEPDPKENEFPDDNDVADYKWDLTTSNSEYWNRVKRLIDSMKIAGIKKKPVFSLGSFLQCSSYDNGNTNYAGPWCHNVQRNNMPNRNTFQQFWDTCPNLDNQHLNCTTEINIRGNWIINWNGANFKCEKEWIKCQYKKLAQTFVSLGADTLEIYSEAPPDIPPSTASVDAHHDLITALRTVPGIKIQVSFNPPKTDDNCDHSEENSKIANFYDSNFTTAWNALMPGITPDKADYFALHSIEPKYLGNYCSSDLCGTSPGQTCPYIPDEMKKYYNQFGESKLELSTDGQHQCAKSGQNTHPMDGEILQALMNLPLPANIAKGINFEYDFDAEGMQGFEKMKNVCSRKDTNVIADIRAKCLEDGPFCFTPGTEPSASCETNPQDIDIVWTSINADDCTVTAPKQIWHGISGAQEYHLDQKQATFKLDCTKTGDLNHYKDDVTIYCKGYCPPAP